MTVVDPSSYPNAGVIRRETMKFERDFTQLPNTWLRDKRLSFAARGLLAHLMTHSDGYQVSLARLAAETWKEGKAAIRTSVGELERAGYLHRARERRRGKFQGFGWYLQDPFEVSAAPPPMLDFEPVDNSSPSSDFTALANRTMVDQPALANRTTIEDQVKNTSSTEVSSRGLDAPVDNFGRVEWASEECPVRRPRGPHELDHHRCRHCGERPLVESAA